MNTIILGSYWQSNDTKKEPIEWLVLKEEDNKAYVISKYCLDYVPYSEDNNYHWRDSYARKWLNEYFFNEAFTEEEQHQILLTDVQTNATYDEPRLDHGVPKVPCKVFLPSIAEAILYFGNDKWNDITGEQRRIARPTNYAFIKGCSVYQLKYTHLNKLQRNYYSWYMKDAFRPDDLYWVAVEREYRYDTEDSYWRTSYGRTFFDETLLDRYNDRYKTKKRWSCGWYLRSTKVYMSKVSENGRISDSSHPWM